jgi:hypothetical protein
MDVTAPESMMGVPFARRDQVRIALIGAGNRQGGLLDCLRWMPAAEIVAIVDPNAAAASELNAVLATNGRPPADIATDHRPVLARDDIDLVIVATPWDTHTPLAVEAMEAGKHVAVEVPAAVTIEECWQLVDTSERTRRHCMMLENCCYGRSELTVLNLVRSGAFGDLLHAGAAYFHDLRELLQDLDWRRRAHATRDGNLYPTHGLGPVAGYLNLNRGDRMTRLVSMSSPHVGLERWRSSHYPTGHPIHDEQYVCGDINTSIIQTALGRTILLQHQVIGARPYGRLNELVGSNGVFSDFPARIFLEDDPLDRPFSDRVPLIEEEDPMTPEQFEDIRVYEDRFLHDLWRTHGQDEGLAGHGGMDYLMLLRLVEAFTEGRAPDMDVYDAASWSSPGPLSVASVSGGAAAVDVPDFTRGRWQESHPGMP